MKTIPNTQNALVLRTDFSDQAVWEALRGMISSPVGLYRFRANVEFLDDPQYDGLTKEQLIAQTSANYSHTFIIIVDRLTITGPDHPVLVIDLLERSGNEFRALPKAVQSVENNLSIANMDFEEFSQAVNSDGVFRGFPRR
jgi:hypothetical protein